jgi:aspartyl aminopeptidase
VLNVEPYGGLILRSWLDRPLGLAGRVVRRGADAFHPVTELVDFARPLVTIPSLAIHMDRRVNEEGKLNAQRICCRWRHFLAKQERATGGRRHWPRCSACRRRKSFPTSFQRIPSRRAVRSALPASSFPRRASIISPRSGPACRGSSARRRRDVPAGVRLVALFDNEEVGSRTKQGAGSMVLPEVLRRIYRQARRRDGA